MMKKSLLFFAAALLLWMPGRAQEVESTGRHRCQPLQYGQTPVSAPTITNSAFASILTCGAGDEFYTSFGHSAIRVCDPATGLDLVYNYGTFDFDIPHFYWTFARGKLNYCLSRTTFGNFIAEYDFEGRAVWEQRLRLTPQELNNLFVMLETNYLPEYRYYMYDFFRDNCATRVRDMVSGCLCHRSLSPECTTDTNLTYRNLLYRSTEETLLWWRLGIDMVLGVRCDKRCSNYEYMFSPLEMMHQFDTLTVSDTGEPLAEPATVLLSETRSPLARSVSPTLLFSLLFLVVLCLTIMEWYKVWNLQWFDRTVYIIVGLLSLVALFLWFFTDHYCTKVNLNILWLSPLFLYFAINPRHSCRYAIYLQLIMLVATIVMTIGPLPQQMNIAVRPIALMLAVRLISNLRKLN